MDFRISTAEKLFENYGGKEMQFKYLPENAKKAIIVYFIDEFDLEVNEDTMFGYVEIPRTELERAIENHVDFDHENFKEYHKWYLDGGDIPRHAEIWPIILDTDVRTDEIIFDGWHRFHWYVSQGIDMIPSILPLTGYS